MAGQHASLADASQHFKAVWSSAFAIIQERNRLADEIASSADAAEHAFLRTFPYFGRDKLLFKHLDTLMTMLDEWNTKYASGLKESDLIPSVEQLNSWTRTVEQLTDLLRHTGQVMNDPHGNDMLRELQEKHPHVLQRQYATHALERESDEPVTQIQTTDAADPSSLNVSRNHIDDQTAAVQLAYMQSWNDQDNQLDYLSASIHRQHNLSVRMNEELELQTGLIGSLDADVESTGLHLGGASTRLERFRQSTREHGTLSSATDDRFTVDYIYTHHYSCTLNCPSKIESGYGYLLRAAVERAAQEVDKSIT